MSLLREIQEAAIDNNVELPTLLRKCKVLAARLGNEGLSNWVDSELNGYSDIDDLPDYRILNVNSKGHFSGPFGSGLRNADIPLICIEEKFRENLAHSYMMEAIASLEALVDKSDGGTAQEPWPPDLVAYVGQGIYENMNCMQAWKVIPITAIIAALDAVRNRILSFVLEIEAEAPDAGEAPLHSNPLPQEKVNQIFNTYISGNVQNVSTGGQNFTQSAQITVTKGDFESLANYLQSHGVTIEDVKELKDAIDEDEKAGHGSEMGPRKLSWMAKMYNKIKSGAWKIGSSVATKVLTEGMNDYLGF